ncbi:lipopolysaccharide/colanic/teichoic acid biosynthesis glycosyltransferase [Sphingobacterium paludis]|uniref:Lipopolysaccharide/colanic/teichoic acid biosynthesis glycosyltransferase n=2 Tax=Sphingobacterium paludis TaxID=1476465 RepID=A0A4R7D0N9_9SPHI|nr:lipopolysaccharide/colanic/teichoic acid biosynthesis glycosyltransferase [Sphingobacterium paludis]
MAMATLFLLLAAPLLLVIAIAIKTEGKGAIIYRARRVGANQQIFTLYKFRTMYQGSELLLKDMLHLNMYRTAYELDSLAVFVKFDNDWRVTRTGRFLRRTHLDELPQLFNVLKGEMSIIGNRPLATYEAEKLVARKEFKRFLAPAGITGLWQIRQHRKEKISAAQRIALDNRYAAEQSFGYDCAILLETMFVLLVNIFKRP